MTDIFDQTIICKKCKKEMKKGFLIRDGFKLRIVECEKCGDKIIHPSDKEEYNDMVRLAFNDAKKLSLFFGEEEN